MKFITLVSMMICSASFAQARWIGGGVSGGGGNLISPRKPEVPASPAVAEAAVRASHDVLKSYIRTKRMAYESHSLSEKQAQVFAPVFSSSQDIESKIADIRMNVAVNESCWDSARRPVDGSIVTTDSNSICISAYNISQKADITDMLPQSTALILHEYSELVGLDEEGAVALQREVLTELRGE